MKARSFSPLSRRQGYGAVTNGLSQAGDALSGSASRATSSLSKPQLIGIIVAIIALAVILVGGVWYACVRAARRRDDRNEAEREQIRQRQNSAGGDSVGDVRIAVSQQPFTQHTPPSRQHESAWRSTGGMQQPTGTTLASQQQWYAAQRRGSEPATDEDYWKHEPLAPVDSYAAAAQNSHQYVVEFDQFGQPRYHAPMPHASTQHLHRSDLPSYGEVASPIMTPAAERQPMYRHH